MSKWRIIAQLHFRLHEVGKYLTLRRAQCDLIFCHPEPVEGFNYLPF